jgi:hypothetical protein
METPTAKRCAKVLLFYEIPNKNIKKVKKIDFFFEANGLSVFGIYVPAFAFSCSFLASYRRNQG